MMKARFAATIKNIAAIKHTPATSLMLICGVASENINIKITSAEQKVSFAKI